MSGGPIRVLVADDSPVFAGAMRAVLESDPELRVVGVASTGKEAIALVHALGPAVVTMDLEMPGLDGYGAIERIMAGRPTAVVVVSSSRRLSDPAFREELRELGVVDVIDKAEAFGGDFEAARRVAAVVRRAAGLPLTAQPRRRRSDVPRVRVTSKAAADAVVPRKSRAPHPAVGLIASTGGPPALAGILAGLEPDFGATVVVVQHLGDGFDAALLAWLDNVCPLPVVLATHGTAVEPGKVYLAPHGRHTIVTSRYRLRLHAPDEIDASDHVPSGNTMLTSLAAAFGRSAVGVALTGMGDDGVDGLRAIRDAGGLTVAQDGETATVDGIPGQARARGAAMQVLRLEAIADFLNRAVIRLGARRQRSGSST